MTAPNLFCSARQSFSWYIYIYTYFIYVSIFIRIAYNAAHVPSKSQQWQLVSLPYTLRYGVTASGKFGTKVRVNSHIHTHTVEWLLRKNNNLLPRCVCESVCVKICTKLSINLIKIDGVCGEGGGWDGGLWACEIEWLAWGKGKDKERERGRASVVAWKPSTGCQFI